ncbi:ribosomal protein S5 domain 2-type protein [Daedaleopsis nitida]|nr:ribosomal protein S5 domain 2-type protein [Daedaleopsis nitida]
MSQPERSRSFTIRVPATSANIGPGFDVVGLSLTLYLTVTITLDAAFNGPPRITYSGEGADEVPLDAYKNLTTRVALYVLRCHGLPRFPPGLTIHCANEIPFGRGLGSSGAAVVAGVLLGNELGQLALSSQRMLDFALMVERHPDNVTAALFGGFVGSYLRELDAAATEAASVPLSEVLPEYPPDAGEAWGMDPPQPPQGIGHYIRFGWSKSIKALAIIPRFELSTAKARSVLPSEYSRKDLVRLLVCVDPADVDVGRNLSGAFAPSYPLPAGVQSTTVGRVDRRARANAARPGTHLRGDEGPRPSALP